MANKPAQLCQLQKGIMVDSQEGFCDTFNWAVNAIANLKGGQNCEVNWTVDDQPTIDCTAEEGDGESGGTPDVSAVYDVVASTSGSQSGINVEYVDARATTFIPFPSGGAVTFYGTDNTYTSASTWFRLSKASNSNIVITANGNTLTIGAYYT